MFQQMIEGLRRTHQEKLLQSRKLVLMVDLDNTLIHATDMPCQCSPSKNIYEVKLENNSYYVRLRPYYKQFLEKMSQLFELNIFTFACRSYAKAVAGILDCDNTLFGQRIISRDDCLYPSSKKANVRFFSPCGESMICMIDDREDVWNFAPGLIAVEPYTYFRNQTRFDTQLQTDTSDDQHHDSDDYLLYLEEVLRRVHTEYYRRYDAYLRKEVSEAPDVSKVVSELRSKTLEGTTIVFSRIAPQSDLFQSPEYHFAKALGARIEQEVVLGFEQANRTTHLISTQNRTSKVLQAKNAKNIHIVSPCWLWCCWYRWERAAEILFSLEDYVAQKKKRRKYPVQPDRPHCEIPYDFVKHISWLSNQRQDLIEALKFSANPMNGQHDNTAESRNNYQQPEDHGSVEMQLNNPQRNEPLRRHSLEPQGRGNDQSRDRADQPGQSSRGSGKEQRHGADRRSKRQRWYHRAKRRWQKKSANHQAQAANPPQPLNNWMQVQGSSVRAQLSPEPYQAPLRAPRVQLGPIRNPRNFGRSRQMNQPCPGPAFPYHRPIPQYPGPISPWQQQAAAAAEARFNHNGSYPGFAPPMQMTQSLRTPEYSRFSSQYPARPWQQQALSPPAQIPRHLGYWEQNNLRYSQMQQQNYTWQRQW